MIQIRLFLLASFLAPYFLFGFLFAYLVFEWLLY